MPRPPARCRASAARGCSTRRSGRGACGALVAVALLLAAVTGAGCEGATIALHHGTAGATPLPPPGVQGPPEGPPKLEWSQLGFTSDHHVGSAPAAHFGLRVRNKGGGELQLSIFINAASARFYVPRPRDLTLLAGQERMVDIRAPLYLLEAESHFRENATATLQSNGGTASFSLTPEAWPQPPHGLRVHQMSSGNHAWHAAPNDAAARLRLGLGGCGMSLLCLWLVARVARRHAYLAAREERLAAARLAKSCDAAAAACWDAEAAMAAAVAASTAVAASDAVERDEDALAAVWAMQEWERAHGGGGRAAAAAKASEKAAALEAWHAASAAPGGAWGAAGSSSGGEPEARRGGTDDAGRPGSAAGGAGAGAAAPPALCTVCLAQPRDTVILPCRHVALCVGCARRLTPAWGADSALGVPPGAGACPICRGRIENYLQVFVS